MEKLIDFCNFLSEHVNISPSSIAKYESAVRVISKEMLKLGVISKPLQEMKAVEYEIALFLILNNVDFRKKNTTGNNMYSNGLKQYQSYLKCVAPDDALPIVEAVKEDAKLSVTEKEAIVKSRIGQGIFRKRLLDKYHKCIVSNIADPRLLIASHIKPWSVSDNRERLSAENGLLLNSLYDKMFDLGLITFKNNGKIVVSDTILQSDRTILKVDEDAVFDLKGSDEMTKNLEYHRDVVFLR